MFCGSPVQLTFRYLIIPENSLRSHSPLLMRSDHHCECEPRFRRILLSQTASDQSVEPLYDLMDKKVIWLLPIDRNDCLTVEPDQTRVMATLAVPNFI